MDYAKIKARLEKLVDNIVTGNAPGEGATEEFAFTIIDKALNELKAERGL